MDAHEVLAAIERASDRFDTQISQPSDLAQRTQLLAELLRDGWPSAMLFACQLTAQGQTVVVVLDEEGRPHADWRRRLDSACSPEEGGHGALWLALLRHTRQPAVVCPLGADARSGLLAMLLRPGTNGDESLARLYLDNLAQRLAQRGLEQSNRCLREDIAALENMAAVAELAGPLAHEFTNFLNVLLLQVSVLEYQLPASEQSDLVEIRRQGNLAADAVSRFHQYRRGQPCSPSDIDLNLVVANIASELASECEQSQVTLTLKFAPAPPLVRSTPADVRRFVRFLLGNAVQAAAQQGKAVEVETAARDGKTVLEIRTSGLATTSTDLLRLFEVSHPQAPGVEGLELAACRSMARRMRGGLRAEESRPGELRLIAEFGRR